MVLEAKKNLYDNNPLQPGQALANVTVDNKREFYGVFRQHTVIVSAEVVDFNKDALSNPKPFKTREEREFEKPSFFKKSDLVYFRKGVNFRKGVVSRIKNGTIEVLESDEKDVLK